MTSKALRKPTGGSLDAWHKRSIRDRITAMESAMAKSPDRIPLDRTQVDHFADGVYARELFMPAGAVITSKIHKTNHFCFILKGKAEVIDENSGGEILEAPCMVKTLRGTKRILRILEDSVWVAVYPTHKTDVAEIEKDLISDVHLDLLEHDGD